MTLFVDLTSYFYLKDPNSGYTITERKIEVRSTLTGSSDIAYRRDTIGDYATAFDVTLNTTGTDDGNNAVFLIQRYLSHYHSVRLIWSAGDAWSFEVRDSTTANTDDMLSISKDTTYYMTMQKVGTTLTLRIYTDAAKTTLADTLTITCTEIDFNEESYCYAGYSGVDLSFDFENVDVDADNLIEDDKIISINPIELKGKLKEKPKEKDNNNNKYKNKNKIKHYSQFEKQEGVIDLTNTRLLKRKVII